MESVRMWRLWTTLALEDLSDRYRRTLLGISWLIASFGLFIIVYLLVFSEGSGLSHGDYALYVAVGFGLWTFINNIVGDACLAYTSSSNWILGVSIPYPVFFFQSAFRNWLAFILTLVVIAAILVWQKPVWSPMMLWAVPGLVLYLFTPLWLTAILAPLCARYRDAQHAINTGMKLLFFATPILWLPTRTGLVGWLTKYNIAVYFIDIVREPLIYDTVPIRSWLIVLAFNVVGVIIGFIVYAWTRNRVVYWL